MCKSACCKCAYNLLLESSAKDFFKKFNILNFQKILEITFHGVISCTLTINLIQKVAL